MGRDEMAFHRKKVRGRRKEKGFETVADHTPEQVVQHADEAAELGDLSTAVNVLKEGLTAHPSSSLVLESYGKYLAEIGQAEDAKEVLKQAVLRRPDAGYEKYMYLGQLLPEGQAFGAFRRGAEILERDFELHQQKGDNDTASFISSQLASALCSMAELRLSSAFESNESIIPDEILSECEALVDRAKTVSPTNFEPLQILASIRIQQTRIDEAKDLLQDSVALWLPNVEVIDKNVDSINEPSIEEDGECSLDAENIVEDDSLDSETEEDGWLNDDETLFPDVEFRIHTAKLLIECNCNQGAVTVLHTVIDENDRLAIVWYLLSLAHTNLGALQEAMEAAKLGKAIAVKQEQGEDIVHDLGELEEDINLLLSKRGSQFCTKEDNQVYIPHHKSNCCYEHD